MHLVKKLIRLPSLPLIIILLIAFILRVNNLNFNSPFLDEAIHIRLGKKVLTGSWAAEAPFSWVGGLPLFYPQITALAYKLAGLVGSRFLNVLLGTYSVYLFYHLIRQFSLTNNNDDNEFISSFGSLLLSILAVPVFLSRLAVYDMLSFTLFLASLLFLEKALTLTKPLLWQRENYFFAGFILLFASFLAKYTTIIYFPVLSFWVYFRCKKKGRFYPKSAFKYFILPLTVSLLFYLSWNFDGLRQFLVNQFNDPIDRSAEILNEFLDYTLLLLPLSLLGISWLYIRGNIIAVYFFIGFLTVPVFHLLTNNLTALSQHTYLSLIFLIPPLSFILSELGKKTTFIKISIALLVLIPVFFQSQIQLKKLETSWSNSNSVMEFLNNNLQNNDKILTSEDDITDLALPAIPEENIQGLWNLEYQGKKDEDAYRQAIQDGYFSLVLINENSGAKNLKIVWESLNERYRLIYDSPPFKIYRLII